MPKQKTAQQEDKHDNHDELLLAYWANELCVAVETFRLCEPTASQSSAGELLLGRAAEVRDFLIRQGYEF
jgi:hypothetical protein